METKRLTVRDLVSFLPLFPDSIRGNLWLRPRSPNTLFSHRELECLFYIMRGMTARAIAIELHLSPRTIETYINSLKIKLKCRRKSEIVIKVLCCEAFCREVSNSFHLNEKSLMSLRTMSDYQYG